MASTSRIPILVFILVVTVALSFALHTQHVWEDYYITWRSSKNLAMGHGLVYQPGDRLHTFTSPLGVLLPAAASGLALNHSDEAALWIFRLMSCLALGATALLLLSLSRSLGHARLAGVLIIGGLALDAKVVDFTINGMETAFLLLFLAYTLWAHLAATRRPWLHLGAAWAGLMWTRPDSFVYIGLIAAGLWVFHVPTPGGPTRRHLLVIYLRAGLLTTALYLPWLLFTWGYYGTPVPHTITAKSGIGEARTLAGLLRTALHLPFTVGSGTNSLEGTFLPAYYLFGEWPQPLIHLARTLATGCALLWLVPFLRPETRATSFAFFGAHVYLSYYPYFPFPWYLPATTLLALFCLGSLVAQVLAAVGKWPRADADSRRPTQVLAFSTIVVGLLLAGGGWLTWQSARLFAAQQRHVEDGNRRKIGEWLRAHANPGDTVFMEPLGYIGYFSGLKTYDFPGMSSREVVAARHKVGPAWDRLIEELRPDWLVLRPHEIQRLRDQAPRVLDGYELVREFSVARILAGLDLYGRKYLEHDARFTLYGRLAGPDGFSLPPDHGAFGLSPVTLDGIPLTFAHAPSTLHRIVPRSALRGTVQFGFMPDAYQDEADGTDGARFMIELVDGETVTVLADRSLDPVSRPEDRGWHRLTFALPPRTGRARLILRLETGPTSTKDWTCWSEVDFE